MGPYLSLISRVGVWVGVRGRGGGRVGPLSLPYISHISPLTCASFSSISLAEISWSALGLGLGLELGLGLGLDLGLGLAPLYLPYISPISPGRLHLEQRPAAALASVLQVALLLLPRLLVRVRVRVRVRNRVRVRRPP